MRVKVVQLRWQPLRFISIAVSFSSFLIKSSRVSHLIRETKIWYRWNHLGFYRRQKLNFSAEDAGRSEVCDVLLISERNVIGHSDLEESDVLIGQSSYIYKKEIPWIVWGVNFEGIMNTLKRSTYVICTCYNRGRGDLTRSEGCTHYPVIVTN